ncbi:hypothetical protein [Verrucomicrobium sp. GAS474]|uniref:hypothetical protein n=1 Tax=Verrucomicrobium sp. GAS474 TaxID=1882831 RepID=UPI000B858A9A|nr:hypothetical protein [Verrucomicrobium sp. GAS474]
MSKGLPLLAFLFFCHAGFAGDIPLNGGTSPSGRYEIRLSSGKELVYLLLREGKRVSSVASSYHSSPDDGGFALKRAEDAAIYWNKAETFVAIDEDNYRFIGDVLVVDTGFIGSGTVLKASSLISARKLAKNVERMRVRVGQGWTGPKTLELSVGGIEKTDLGSLRRFEKKVTLTFSSAKGVEVTP